MASRFKNHLRFALRKESSEIRELLSPNRIEKLGDKLSWFAYEFKEFCSKFFYDPRVLTIWFTAIAMIFTALLFYPSNTWSVLSTIFQSIIDRVNWSYIRFCLWVISEITILGMGMRAFGRFTNPALLKYYKDQNAFV